MKKLIQKYKNLIQEIVNPDDLTWDDIGCDEPIEGFKDINDYLENGDESEFNEGHQTEIRIYHELINDLENYNY